MKNMNEKMRYGLIGLGLLLSVGIPVAGYTEIGDVLRGARVFGKNCVICHGNTAKGDGVMAKSLPVQPANLTDCRRTAEDPIEVLEGTIRHGGTYTGLSSVMPAWGKKLSDQEISDVAAYVKTLCTKKDWLTGDFNFPRPLVTGKAFPEQEVIFGGKYGQGEVDQSSTSLALEYRLDGLTNMEVSTSVRRTNAAAESGHSGIGDTSISMKRVLTYSYESNYLITAGIKAQFPTGNEDFGLGAGEIIWQPSLRAGIRRGDIVTQIDTRVTIPAESSDINTRLRYNMALAYVFQPDPRLEVVPILELTNETRLNGPQDGRTTRTVVPQFRIKWLQYSAGFGVQIPLAHAGFDLRPLFDLTYEYLF